MQDTQQWVDVVVGVLVRAELELLFAQRPAGKPMAGFWEFPGGKVEAGETHHQALRRELQEELGIEIVSSLPWRTVEYVYAHAAVRLHFLVVTQWEGTPQACEQQALCWQALHVDERSQVHALRTEPILPATVPLLDDLHAWLHEHMGRLG
jgi:8-oxo-dGTP diphosphatase